MSWSRTPIERFFAKVAYSPETGCWLWTASTTRGGYGQFKVEPKMWKAHRWLYFQSIGPVPEGMQLDHLCRNTRCVNPAHLEPVTAAENLRRADVAAGVRSGATHCKNGHEFTPENTRHYTHPSGKKRSRLCAICKRANSRRSYWKAS